MPQGTTTLPIRPRRLSGAVSEPLVTSSQAIDGSRIPRNRHERVNGKMVLRMVLRKWRGTRVRVPLPAGLAKRRQLKGIQSWMQKTTQVDQSNQVSQSQGRQSDTSSPVQTNDQCTVAACLQRTHSWSIAFRHSLRKLPEWKNKHMQHQYKWRSWTRTTGPWRHFCSQTVPDECP